MPVELLDDFEELVWKLPNTSWRISDFNELYKHNEVSLLNLLSEQKQSEELQPTADYLILIHRKSLVMLLYAFLEEHLFELCQLSEIHFDHTIKTRDLNGRGIEQCKKYLTKVLGISWQSLNVEWEFIIQFQFVRNTYVHKPNDEKRKKRAEFIGKHCNGAEALPPEYLEKSLDNIDIFFQKLQEKIVEKDNMIRSNHA